MGLRWVADRTVNAGPETERRSPAGHVEHTSSAETLQCRRVQTWRLDRGGPTRPVATGLEMRVTVNKGGLEMRVS